MYVQIIKPSSFLARYIRHYWVLEIEPSEKINGERVLPAPNAELMFHYKTPFKVVESGSSFFQPRSLIKGVSTNFIDAIPCGNSGVIAVTFHPIGACHFFPFPLKDIENKIINLQDLSLSIEEVEQNMSCQTITHTPADNPEIVDCSKLIKIAEAMNSLINAL